MFNIKFVGLAKLFFKTVKISHAHFSINGAINVDSETVLVDFSYVIPNSGTVLVDFSNTCPDSRTLWVDSSYTCPGSRTL